jgi:RNA ligase-like protein
MLPIPTPITNPLQLAGKHLSVQEQLDGDSVSLSFDDKANIVIELLGNPDAKRYGELYEWAHKSADTLFDLLHSRYVLYGIWALHKRSIYYDSLCSFFIEHDIFDKEAGIWLSTNARHSLISKCASKLICSAPLIKLGKLASKDEWKELIALPSFYRTEVWKDTLQAYCVRHKLVFDDVMGQTDNTPLMSGLYIKVENEGSVVERYSYVRDGFVAYETSFAVQNEVADV